MKNSITLDEALCMLKDGWRIVTADGEPRVIIGGDVYTPLNTNKYSLTCRSSYISEVYGEGCNKLVTVEIRDNLGNTIWKKPKPEESQIKSVIQPGDYFSAKDIKQYAADNKIKVDDVCRMLMDKMLEAGAQAGEGVCYVEYYDYFGWYVKNFNNGCFYADDSNKFGGFQLSVSAVLSSQDDYVQVSKTELERLRSIANNLGKA